MTKEAQTVDAIVRGPKPYFHSDGKLYGVGQIVRNVPADQVSTADTYPEEVEVEARNGDLRKRTIERRVKFRPVGSQPVAADPQTTADVATGNPDRLNVTDFLKGGTDEIVAAIVSGSVDSHLGAIEQAELSRKGPARVAVKEAIAARLAASAR
jgi:hypothetical protein